MYQRGVPPQAVYTFKHALIQDTAYESLLRTTRQVYHRRIAEVLEKRFPEIVETHPELIAYHFTAAQLNEEAIDYWYRAGQKAEERSAYIEANSHLNTGLELLSTLPGNREWIEKELALQMSLGPVLMATQGHASSEVEQVYNRAQELCKQLDDPLKMFPAIWGLCRFYFNRAKLQTARELGEQLLILAQQVNEPGHFLAAHAGLGTILYFMGEFISARMHLEAQVDIPSFEQQSQLAVTYGVHPGVQCLSFATQTLFILGFPDQALHRSHEALDLAQSLSHPPSLALALYYGAIISMNRREIQDTRKGGEALLNLAKEHHLPHWVALGRIVQGWALGMSGQDEEGLTQLHLGLTESLALGVHAVHPMALVRLSGLHMQLRRIDEGIQALNEAKAMTETSGQIVYQAEQNRQMGELLLGKVAPDALQAKLYFQKALEVSRRQQAKSWELRAATGLARLWQSQGKRDEARDLLAPVYGWFTEGFNTADLQDAKTLLDELS